MTLIFKQCLTLIIGSFLIFGFFNLVEAGGRDAVGERPSGSDSRNGFVSASYTQNRAAAEASAQGYRDFSAAVGRPQDYGVRSTYNAERGWGYSVGINEPQRGDGNNGFNPGTSNGNQTQLPCTATQPNLTTIDIFFVRAGAQPVTTPAVLGSSNSRPANNQGGDGNGFQFNIIPASISYATVMVPRNELEVGVVYEPIAQIRNVAGCVSRAAVVNSYPNNTLSQSPFGSGGSFPVRARIDVGNNTIIDWEHYLNATGPVANRQTIYLRLPAFSTTETGTHSIEIVTDIRHSIDPGRGCFAPATPNSAGLGCIGETNERDNDRQETFTTIGNSSTLLQVNVDDVMVPARSELTEIPFVVTNNSTQTITNYQYTVQIASVQFANANRTTALIPGSRETMRAVGRYQVPSTNTALPITVCARVGTNAQSCDTARLIVVAPQCSDGRDNDTDTTADRNDMGCLTNPLDPTTYDPNDNNEADVAVLTPPTITLEAESAFVRSNNTARVSYSVRADYPMTCQLRGPGINDTFNYTSGTYERTVTTEELINKQNIAITCTPGVPPAAFEPTTREITIEIIPQIQEV
ncbi:hypothetical protein K2P47_05255 [Patescibacteria group bacterium]|nr:hypothetical protein [Patescibacteria group bacterium]